MDSIIMSTEEETLMIWATEEQISDVVRLKVSGTICNIILLEGEVVYEADIRNLYLIQ